MSNEMLNRLIESNAILKSLIGLKVEALFADEAERAFESIILRTSNGDIHVFLDEENACDDVVPIVVQAVDRAWTEQAVGTIKRREEDEATPFYRTAFTVGDTVESVQVAYCMEEVDEVSIKDVCAILLKLTSSWIVLEKAESWTSFWDWSITKGENWHLLKRTPTEVITLSL
jgi:hypothetical protein